MSFGSRKPAPTRRSVPARPRASAPPAPVQQSKGGGIMSGIGSTIAQGMAFGTGSAIAHRAVGAVAGSMSGGDDSEVIPEESGSVDQFQSMQMPNQICATDKQMFFECLQTNKGDQEACRFLYDMLKDCQRNSASSSM